MNVFFGAAIQGHLQRGERAHVYRHILKTISNLGHSIYSEHTAGNDFEEVIRLMDQAIGPLPKTVEERIIYVRDKMIEGTEGNIDAAVFEVSTPSLGTGIELAHAYLRPRMGLKAVPILALYEKDSWPNNASTMIRGITPQKVPNFHFQVYEDEAELTALLKKFLASVSVGDGGGSGDALPAP